jgi:hypothetical protein
MIMIEGLFFYRVERKACGPAVDLAVESAALIYSDAAASSATFGYYAFVGTETAMDPAVFEGFVV